jgi:hypothetical protein
MTGKDLILVVLVAGVAGAAAGIGATVANPQAAPEMPAELVARLDRIETALARAGEEQKAAKDANATLAEKVTGLQMDLGNLRQTVDTKAPETADESAAPAEIRRGRAARRVVLGDGKPVQIEGGNMVLGGPGGEFQFTQELPQVSEEIAKRMKAVSAGTRLRMLPEAERWRKAQDDLHLSDAQVDTIKRAIADRDAALKEAMQVETTNDNGNTRLTFRRMDPAKAATANQDYEKRVTDTLDADQEKTWKENGYDHAFGGGGGVSTIVLSASTIELSTDETKTQK